MNSDIRIAVSFKTHRKRKKLTSMIGHKGVCCLIDLWIGVAMSNPSGMLTAWDNQDIANEAGWNGDPEKFVSALIECRFLDRDESGTYKLHDWADHQGYVVHADKRKEKARQAAEVRWKNKRGENASSMPVAYEEQSISNAPSPSPSPSPEPVPSPKAEKAKESFLLFYETYPKKKAKADAEKAFLKLSPDNETMSLILSAIERQKESDDWKKDGGKFIPYPATWIRARRWEDQDEQQGGEWQ